MFNFTVWEQCISPLIKTSERFSFYALIYTKFAQLLEVTARAIHLAADWGELGLVIADGLSNLLKVTFPP